MFLFDIDEDKSRQQADRLLKRYWRIRHIAGSVSHLKSPSYNHTPSYHSNENGQETCTIKAIEAQQVIDNIESVLGSYDGITDKLFDIIHHKGAFYYGN